MGIASLVLGIVSLTMAFLELTEHILFGAIPSTCAIVGVILGIMQNKQEKDNKATIGIVLCIIYAIVFIVAVVSGIMKMKRI